MLPIPARCPVVLLRLSTITIVENAYDIKPQTFNDTLISLSVLHTDMQIVINQQTISERFPYVIFPVSWLSCESIK